jgi:glycosyltransferase involved in cell wall biosynthesis
MSSNKKGRVLYFYTAESPFVEKDIEIINSEYEVIKFFFNVYDKKKIYLIIFRQFFFLIKNIWFSQITVTQFAGLHAVLPVLFAKFFFKKSVIVSGGTDCVSFPSINYGNFSNKNNAKLTAICFNNTSLILPVHESLIFTDYTYQPNDYQHQGIKQFIPQLKTKYQVVYNGYDNEYWFNKSTSKTKTSFVTVLGHVNSKFTLLLKGIDLYIEMARKFPEATFTIVGGASIKIEDKPNNLVLLSNIWGAKMVDVFSEHQFYMQLSMSEGFPNALSEAMLCECVPIVSNVGGMPDIVADCGYILKHKNINELYELVSSALNNFDIDRLGKKARQRVVENYTFENRKEQLLLAVSKLI